MTVCRLIVRSKTYLAAALLLVCSGCCSRPAPSKQAQERAEQFAVRSLEAARANPLQLRHFLSEMPKGADLHVHIGGAVYAESFIRAGAEDGLCVNVASLAFVRSPRTSGPARKAACESGQVPAAQAYKDQHLYDALVDSFSMRGYVPSPGVTGHDHFFDTFAKFGGTDPHHLGEWIDEIATRAAAQNEQYLELMHTPDFRHAAAIATKIGWKDNFSKLRDELLARGLRDEVATASASINEANTLRRQREKCGQQDEG
jgi:adenosine deaminase